MTSKLEAILSNAISGLNKKADKPPPARPPRPATLSLPSLAESPDKVWGSGPWSPVTSSEPPSVTKSLPIYVLPSSGSLLPSDTKSPPTQALLLPRSRRSQSLPHVPMSSRPPVALKDRRYIGKTPLLGSIMEERLAQLEIENTSLRQANEVLYRQNADYRELVEEYRTFMEKATTVIDGHIGIVDVLEDLTREIRRDAKAYQLIRSRIRRVEREKTNNWNIFVEAKAKSGIKVGGVVRDIADEHTKEMSLYTSTF